MPNWILWQNWKTQQLAGWRVWRSSLCSPWAFHGMPAHGWGLPRGCKSVENFEIGCGWGCIYMRSKKKVPRCGKWKTCKFSFLEKALWFPRTKRQNGKMAIQSFVRKRVRFWIPGGRLFSEAKFGSWSCGAFCLGPWSTTCGTLQWRRL